MPVAPSTRTSRSRAAIALPERLEDRGHPLPAADAHRLEAEARVAPAQLAQQGGEDTRAGGADGVPERDARAVHVDTLEPVRQLPLAQHRERLRGERLVELDEVDVRERE